jgi:gliding motility-associated-like protein
MKRSIINFLTILFWCGSLTAAVPTWSVNPSDYSNSMVIVGTLRLNGTETLDENDIIAAFVDGQVRGVANVQYQPSVDRYLAFLIIYGNESNKDITFKMYDANVDAELDAYNTTVFSINGLIGTASDPFVWSNVALNTGTEITAFNFPESDGVSAISSNAIAVDVIYGTDVTTLLPTFSLSEGASLWVDDQEYVSGASSFDFTEPIVYEVLSESEQESKTYTVSVNVTNHPPTDLVLLSNQLNENNVLNAVIGAFSVTDDDSGHTFSFVTGVGDDNNGLFKIENGQVLAKANFDYETKNSFTIRVKATDTAEQELEKILEVLIKDINDAPTDILVDETVIDEDISIGTVIGQLSTVDQDGVDSFSYSISGSTDKDFFDIQGAQLVSAKSFNFEMKSSFTITFISEDSAGKIVEKAFDFSIVDQNDSPTDIILDNGSVPENLALGAVVGGLNSQDEDVSDTHIYSLVAGEGDSDNGNFSISSGQLVTKQTLDFESKASHSVRLQTTDREGAVFEKVFTISIIDTNDNPTILNISASGIDENSPVGSDVGVFSIVDVDPVAPVYTMIPGNNDNDKFLISGDILKSLVIFDFELDNQYFIDVQANDGAGGIIVKRFEVGIQDANDAPEQLNLSANTINEGQVIGTTIGEFSDVDQDAIDQHQHTLIDGMLDNSFFQIDGNVLKSNIAFDFEQKSIYSIQVRSTDLGGAFIDQTFSILVGDSGDSPTDLLISAVEIEEELPIGSVIGELSALDQDIDERFTFSLVTGSGDGDNSEFAIDGNRLISKSVFDAESKTSYSVRIDVKDSKDYSISKNFDITILLANEQPEITSQQFSIKERSEVSSVVGSVLASDVDGDQLIYSLEDASFPFEINTTTGEITISENTLDYEKILSYAISIRVTDPGGLFAFADMEIEIVDVIESELPLPANNFISPNNDGFNDFFMIQNPDLYQDYKLTIFNNAGKVVFTMSGYDNTWSGTDNSRHDLAPGAYYYTFKSSSNPVSFKGSLTLVR